MFNFVMMKIRTYEKADRAACISVFMSNVPDFFLEQELKDFENWLTAKDKVVFAFNSNQAEHYYVVEVEDKIIGCGGFYIHLENKEARMAWGMIDKRYHKNGLGREFLKFRITQILAINPEITIALDTTQFSYPFFEKLGFKVTRIQKDFYGINFDRYDMVLSRHN